MLSVLLILVQISYQTTTLEDAQNVGTSVWHLAKEVTYYASLRSIPIVASVQQCIQHNGELATYGYCLASSDYTDTEKVNITASFRNTTAHVNDQ